jgi:hypothetical protein
LQLINPEKPGDRTEGLEGLTETAVTAAIPRLSGPLHWDISAAFVNGVIERMPARLKSGACGY